MLDQRNNGAGVFDHARTSAGLDRANEIGARAGSDGRRPARLDAEQRTRVRSILQAGNTQPIDHPNFAIQTGAVVPSFYQFYSLPAVLADLYPEYSGYDYVLVGNEILVIDPGTRRIVDIIET